MVDLIEMYVHWYAGRSKSEVAQSLGVDRATLRKYLAPAEAAGMVPGGTPVMSEADWRIKAALWWPQVADAKLRQVSWPAIAEHRDWIVEQLAARVTVSTIHQRLRDERGLPVGITSVRRWIVEHLPEEVVRSKVTVARPAVPAGEEAQIDYGMLGMWTDPATGKRRRVDAFVMVLACSRHMFVYPVVKMDQRAWTAAHVAAFEFFGGSPRRLVPDNLRTGVDKADLYDPKLNRSYAELAVHYGTLIDPARSRKPKDKARVERAVSYVRDSFWRGRDFTSLQQMRDAARAWSVEVAGARSHRGLDGAAPAAVFAAVEAGALIPLPPAAFVLADWSTPKVAPDAHAKVGLTLYSVPWRLIGQRLDARATALTVQFFHNGELVKTHIRKERGKLTDHTDLPEEKIAFYLRTPTWCRKTAQEVGPACVEVIAALAEAGVMSRLRSAQAILNLRDRHSPGRLEAACRKALDAGDPSYRTIKGILALGTETDPMHRPTGDGGAASFLHGPSQQFARTLTMADTDEPTFLPTPNDGAAVRRVLAQRGDTPAAMATADPATTTVSQTGPAR